MTCKSAWVILSGAQLLLRRSRLYTRKDFFSEGVFRHWNRLPRGVMGSLFLGVEGWGDEGWGQWAWGVGWTQAQGSQRALPILMILWTLTDFLGSFCLAELEIKCVIAVLNFHRWQIKRCLSYKYWFLELRMGHIVSLMLSQVILIMF